MFCIRKNICSHRKKNLLLVPCKMAAVAWLPCKTSLLIMLKVLLEFYESVSCDLNTVFFCWPSHSLIIIINIKY